MGKFSFTATARCDECGNYLSSSTEDCDHDGEPVEKRLFRRLGEGRESLVGVKTTPRWKWYKLKEEVGDDWIAYEYLGTMDHVNAMLDGVMWDDVEDLPKISMSIDAPNDVEDHNEDDG